MTHPNGQVIQYPLLHTIIDPKTFFPFLETIVRKFFSEADEWSLRYFCFTCYQMNCSGDEILGVSSEKKPDDLKTYVK